MTDALVPVDIEALDLLPLDERVDAIGEDRPVAGGGNRRPPQCWSFAGARGFCSPKLGCGPLRVSGPREPLRTRSHKGDCGGCDWACRVTVDEWKRETTVTRAKGRRGLPVESVIFMLGGDGFEPGPPHHGPTGGSNPPGGRVLRGRRADRSRGG